MNVFVTENLDKMKKCLQKLSTIPTPTDNVKPAPVPKGPPLKESLRTLMSGMAEMKDILIEKLHGFDTQTYIQSITFKTSERLISVCVEIGMPRKGKKTILTPNDAKVDDLVLLLAEEEKLVAEIADLANQDRDEKMLSALVYILTSADPSKTTALIKSCITREIMHPLDSLLTESMTCQLFKEFGALISGNYLKELLVPFIEELNESKEELKPNSDKLMEITQKLLANILKSLTSTCPLFIWEICSHFYQESKNAKTRSPIEKLVAVLFLCLFIPAIDTPENFVGISDLPKKKVRKSLSLCSEVLRYIATSPGDDVKDTRMLQFIKKRYEITCQLVEDWMVRPVELKGVPPISPTWNTFEEFLRTVHHFMCDKMSTINQKLGTSGTTKKVTFKLAEFCDSLIASGAVTTKMESTKSSVF